MKRLTAILLCLILCLGLLPGAAAPVALGRDLTFETQLAGQLQALGLFQGTGDGGFELDRAPSRTEALVMLVRALGKGTEAEAHPKTHPFTDVPPWADGYVSYAWEQGLTKGVSDTRFGAADTATAETYLTFMLRVLGYQEGSAGQFLWDAPWAAAGYAGILPPQVDRHDFLRADAVIVTCAALYADLYRTGTPLHKKLAAEGVFTEEGFAASFPADPLADYRALDAAVTEAVMQEDNAWPAERPNHYRVESHILAKVQEKDGVLTVEVIVCTMDVEVRANSVVGDHGQTTAPWVFKIDPATFDVLDITILREFEVPDEDILSPEIRAEWTDTPLGRDLPWLCMTEAIQMIGCGEMKYRPLTYAETIEKLAADYGGFGYLESQRLEAKECTILLYLTGSPHGSSVNLSLVFKPGSALKEGTVVQLPLPANNIWGTNSEPVELRLSEDGGTLYYSYHFEYQVDFDDQVLHEAGTYRYTTDLTTGKTELEILPDP